jgi:hypothetical protein
VKSKRKTAGARLRAAFGAGIELTESERNLLFHKQLLIGYWENPVL